jgi:hypothetical protein
LSLRSADGFFEESSNLSSCGRAESGVPFFATQRPAAQLDVGPINPMSNLPPSHLLPPAASRAFAPARVSASLPAFAPGIRARWAGVCSSCIAAVVVSRGSRSAPAVLCAALVSDCALAPQSVALVRWLSLGRAGSAAPSLGSRSAWRRGSVLASAALAPAAAARGRLGALANAGAFWLVGWPRRARFSLWRRYVRPRPTSSSSMRCGPTLQRCAEYLCLAAGAVYSR